MICWPTSVGPGSHRQSLLILTILDSALKVYSTLDLTKGKDTSYETSSFLSGPQTESRYIPGKSWYEALNKSIYSTSRHEY